MRFNEFKSVEVKYLGESKGFFGRAAGDTFTHQDGREYKIVQVVALPAAGEIPKTGAGLGQAYLQQLRVQFKNKPDQKAAQDIIKRSTPTQLKDLEDAKIPLLSDLAKAELDSRKVAGKFASPEERDAAIKQFQQEHGGAEIEWVNSPRKDMLAFGIAQLDDQDGNHVFWGKYLQSVSFDMMGAWANKQTPPGWALQTKGAQKFAAGFDPQALIRTEQEFDGVDSIISTVVNNAEDQVKEVFKEALQNLAQGRGDVVFPEMYEQQAAIRDYFGEIMQPVALIGGVIKGQAEEARQILADGAEWRDCKVMWPMSMNAALCDSFMIAPNGQEIGISSKGGQGAAASSKNLNDAALKAEKEGNTDLLESAKYTIDIVRTIADNDQYYGPIAVGKLLEIEGVDDKLYAEIQKYIKEGKSDLNNLSPAAAKIVEPFNVKLETKGFNTGYAILSAVSKTCAKVVNANPEFSKGCLALLNQSSIIQLYTNIGKKGNDAVLKEFRAVYPPNFEGVVKLEGGKNYYSSRVGGKMAFKID